MSQSNVRQNIEDQVAVYRGEREDKLAHIARIEQLVPLLPALRERGAQLNALIEASAVMMRDRDPNWSAETIAPRRRHAHRSPIPFGEATPMVLDILRTAIRGLKTREIAREMLSRVGELEPTSDLLLQIQSGVDAALRKREGVQVTSVDPLLLQMRDEERLTRGN
jgi:hypothetical protein